MRLHLLTTPGRLRPWAIEVLVALSLLAGEARVFAQSAPPRATLGDPVPTAEKPGLPGRSLSLGDLIQLSLAQNPALSQAGFDIEVARGEAVQAGLYPNPMVSVNGGELGGVNGQQGGIITAPMVSQEIVTAGKRKLSMAIANRKLDQASLLLVRQRLILTTAVRQGYYEVLTARRRVETLHGLEKIAVQSYDVTKRLVETKQAALLDLLQVQVELNRIQAELEAAGREQTAAWRRLMAIIGAPDIAEAPLSGSIESPLPSYDYDKVQKFLVENHPEVGYARVGVTSAELALRREQAGAVPNVTLAAGYVRDNQEKMDLWMFQVGMPVPVFNRNQGSIQSARAGIGKSVQEVQRVQNDLTGRLAMAYGNYAAAKGRGERYRKTILPAAQQAYQIALDAFKGGQFEYLRVLQAQRSVQEATLEYLRALGDAWRASSEIEGLLLKED